MKKTTVAEVMTRKVVAVHGGAQFKEIVDIMRGDRISALPVLDAENHVIGVVSEGDLLVKEAVATGAHATRRRPHPAGADKADEVLAAGLMTHPAVTIGRDATVAEAASLMSKRRVRRLPVVDDWGHLIGLISQIDVLSVFDRPDEEIRAEACDVARKFGLDSQAVEVSVRSGIVTITGEAGIPASIPNLLDAIRYIEGVVEVRDRLSYPHDDAFDAAAVSGSTSLLES